MKSATAFAFIFLASVGACSFAAPVACMSYGADLHTMVQVDQALRERIQYDSPPPVGAVKESDLPKIYQQVAIVDRVHAERLKKLVRACGWPRKSAQGAQAAGAAWLLAQHADPQAQRDFLPHLESAVKAGEASPSDLAYLTDRIAVTQGRAQLYGTQWDMKGPCDFELEKLDDRNKVNARRKSAGMPSLEEYERQFRESISSQGCPAK